MREFILITTGLILSSFLCTQDINGMTMPKKPEEKQVQQVTYTCPMHPEIHSTKPGNCPKCGMKLVKEKAKVVTKPPVKKKTGNGNAEGHEQAKENGHG